MSNILTIDERSSEPALVLRNRDRIVPEHEARHLWGVAPPENHLRILLGQRSTSEHARKLAVVTIGAVEYCG